MFYVNGTITIPGTETVLTLNTTYTPCQPSKQGISWSYSLQRLHRAGTQLSRGHEQLPSGCPMETLGDLACRPHLLHVKARGPAGFEGQKYPVLEFAWLHGLTFGFTLPCLSLPSNLVPPIWPQFFPDRPGSYPHQSPCWSEWNHRGDDLPFF